MPRRQTGPPSGSLNAAALSQSLPSHLSPALFEGEIGVAIGHRRRLSSKGSVLSDGSSPASLALSLPPQPSPVRPPLTAPARPPLGARFGSTRTSVTLSVPPPPSDERRPPSAQRPGRRMSPMSPNQLSRRMSPGPLSRNRNMSVLATLPTPSMKRKLSTIHKKLDAEELANHVEANTVQAAFLGNKRRGNRELLNKIVEQAHLSARGRYDDLSEGKGPLTLNMHWLMRLDILGLEVQNVVLCILECLVPFGSLVVTAIAVYGTGLPTMAVAALFSTHSAAIGIGAFLWTRLARVQPIPRCMGLAGLSQSVLLPLLYAPSQWGAAATFALTALQGLAAGAAVPIFHGFNYSNKWAGDTGIAAARMAVVEPARLALQMGAIALISSLEPDAARLPPTGVQAVFVAFAVVVSVVGAFAFYVPLDPKLRLPPVSTAPSFLRLHPAFSLLVLGDAAARLGGFADVVFLEWLMLAGFSRAEVSAFFYAAAATGFAVALGMCICVVKLHAMARPTLLALAFGTFAPTLLGLLAAASAPRLGPVWTRLLLGLALMLAAVKRIAASQLRVFALPSRWRYVQFSASATMLLQLIEAASPWLLFGLATLFDLDLELRETYSDVLALSFTLLSLPFACAQFVIPPRRARRGFASESCDGSRRPSRGGRRRRGRRRPIATATTTRRCGALCDPCRHRDVWRRQRAALAGAAVVVSGGTAAAGLVAAVAAGVVEAEVAGEESPAAAVEARPAARGRLAIRKSRSSSVK